MFSCTDNNKECEEYHILILQFINILNIKIQGGWIESDHPVFFMKIE